jgi:hypothetical protein
MKPMEESLISKREAAYEISSFFSNILSFNDAMELNNDDIQFFYKKMREIKGKKSDTTKYEHDEVALYKIGRCKYEHDEEL